MRLIIVVFLIVTIVLSTSCDLFTVEDTKDVTYDGAVLRVPDDVTIYYQGQDLGSTANIPDNHLVGLIRDSTAFFYHTALGNSDLNEETSRKALGIFICSGILEERGKEAKRDQSVFTLDTGIEVSPSGSQYTFKNKLKRFAAVDNHQTAAAKYLLPRGDFVELNWHDAFINHSDLVEFGSLDEVTIDVDESVFTYGASIRCFNNINYWPGVRAKNLAAIQEGADPTVLDIVNRIDLIYVISGLAQEICGVFSPVASLSYLVNTMLDIESSIMINMLTHDDHVSEQLFKDFFNNVITGFIESVIEDGTALLSIGIINFLWKMKDIVGALAWTADNVYVSCSEIQGSLPYASWSLGSVPINGLVAYYPFTGNINDESGNGNHGSNVGASPADDRFGTPNCAYYFNNGTRISVPHSDLINFGANDSFAISLWFRINSDPFIPNWEGWLIDKWNYSLSQGYPYAIRLVTHSSTSVGEMVCCRWSSNHNGSGVSSEVSLIDNQYHHLLFIKHGTQLHQYIDGQLVSSSTDELTNSTQNTTELSIGSSRFHGHVHPFHGDIDDIRIYNRALENYEIQILFHENGWY